MLMQQLGDEVFESNLSLHDCVSKFQQAGISCEDQSQQRFCSLIEVR